MKKEAEKKKSGKVLAYPNILQRVVQLSEKDLITQIKVDIVDLHSRKDYYVNESGIRYLIPYYLQHPEEIKTLTDYIKKFHLDPEYFGAIFLWNYEMATKSLVEYEKNTKALIPHSLIHEGIEDFTEFNVARNALDYLIMESNKDYKQLVESPTTKHEVVKGDNSRTIQILKDIINQSKVKIPLDELNKIYYECDTCADFPRVFSRYVWFIPGVRSGYIEPKSKNKRLFLQEHKKFLEHLNKEHLRVNKNLKP